MFGKKSNKTKAKPIVDMVRDRQFESQAFREACQEGELSLVDEWEQNCNHYLGNQWNNRGAGKGSGKSEGYRVVMSGVDRGSSSIERIVLNRDQNAIIANVADQTTQPMVIRFEPTESGDASMWFFSRAGRRILFEMIYAPLEAMQQSGDSMENMQVAQEEHMAQFQWVPRRAQLEGEHGPVEPLDDYDYHMAKQVFVDTQLLRLSDIIAVDDTLRQRVAQRTIDRLMDEASFERLIVMNELFSNIIGHAVPRIEWQTEGERKHRPVFENMHVLNVWPDHLHTFIEDMDYLIYDRVLPLELAIKRYPDAEAKLRKAASDGKLDTGGFRTAALVEDTDFKRTMVVLRVAYLRHQDVPMTEEEALDEELVEAGEPDEEGNVTYKLVKGGQPTKPTNKIDHGTNWPNTVGLRQTLILPQIDSDVQDIRCPYCDIPVGWNLNIPRPDGSCYGQGEPSRLANVSKAINRTASVLVNQIKKAQFPELWLPTPVYDALMKVGASALNGTPGKVRSIPLDVWRDLQAHGGVKALYHHPPDVNASMVSLLDKLLAEHDRLSGNADVRQGKSPYAGASGKTIRNLQEAAAGPLAFKSKFTEYTVRRLAMLTLDATVKWLPEKHWARINNQLELTVLREVIKGLDPREFNVVVEIASGRGMNRQIDEERTLQLWNGGQPNRLISNERARTNLGVEDGDSEDGKIARENAQAAGQVAPTPGSGAPSAAAPPMVPGTDPNVVPMTM